MECLKPKIRKQNNYKRPSSSRQMKRVQNIRIKRYKKEI